MNMREFLNMVENKVLKEMMTIDKIKKASKGRRHKPQKQLKR